MKELLMTAGVKQQVLNLIQVIIDTCPTCRAWQSRGVRPVHTSRVVLDFNTVVQHDLLFWKDY
eukprot:4036823-Heterocapsa_arctica.AAC.1